MGKDLYIGLDIGTSSVKCIVINESGTVISIGQEAYSASTPEQGWVEQDPMLWWIATKSSVRKALAGGLGSTVRGIGITGQMHGLVMVDRTMHCLRPAIIWVDTRSQAQVEQIIGADSQIQKRIGGPMAAGFLLPSLLWVKQNEADVFDKAYKVLTPKDYVRMLLTSKIAIDPTDACGTGAFDVETQDWDISILSILSIDPELFPTVISSLEVGGLLEEEPAEALGLPPNIPVAAGCGDVQASAVGVGVTTPKHLLVNIGTGGQVFQLTEAFHPDSFNRFHTMLHADGEHWHTLGAILSGGLAIDWVSTIINKDVKKLLQETVEASACESGLFFLPYLIGERTPYMDTRLTGSFLGLKTSHTREDLSKATLEGIGFALYNAYTATQVFVPPADSIRAGGGPLADEGFRQIIADIFGLPLHYSAETNTSAVGAAYIGLSVATGQRLKDITAKAGQISGITEPNLQRHERYSECFFQQFRSLSELWLEASRSG